MTKNKKMIILLLILIISIFLICSKNTFLENKINYTLDKVSITKGKNNMLAMYIKNGSDYIEYTDGDTFPTGYELDIDQSKCIDNNDNVVSGVLSQNSDGTITVTSNRTLYCYLYFDTSSITIDDLKGKVGTGGLQETNKGDLQYRYVGIDTEDTSIDNYICIDGNKCNTTDTLDQNETSPYLYRIIGITENGSLKLVKATQLAVMGWHNSNEDVNWNPKSGSNSDAYNYMNGEEVYSNNNVIPTSMHNKILNTIWNIGIANINISTSGDSILDNEIKETSNLSKIGLMYLSDVYYAFNNGSGDQDCYRNNSYCKSWLVSSTSITNRLNSLEYTMTKSVTNSVWSIGTLGNVGQGPFTTATGAVRPVFYLVPGIQLKGSGKINDPYVIQEKTLGDDTKDKIDSIEGTTAPSVIPEDTNFTDLQYRYVGSIANNYICIDGNKCSNKDTISLSNTSNYLYRIIGIATDGSLKLIKAVPTERKQWYDSSEDIDWEKSSLKSYLNGTEILDNVEYIPSTLKDKILNKTWNIGAVKTSANNGPIKEITTLEKEKISSKFKIGLMYLSDWYYAYNETGAQDCGKSPRCISWLTEVTILSRKENADNMSEWTMAYYGLSNVYRSWAVYFDGNINYNILSNQSLVRPVFYLDNTIEIKSGTGKPEDPFVINLDN